MNNDELHNEYCICFDKVTNDAKQLNCSNFMHNICYAILKKSC